MPCHLVALLQTTNGKLEFKQLSNFAQIMEKKTDFIKREQRFSLEDLHGVNVVVRRADGDTEEVHAKLMDFSRNGIKLRMPVNVQFEEILLVRIEFDNSSLSYLGEASVRHMRSDDGNKTFQVGCRVEPAIPDCVVEYLAENSGKERRANQRTAVQVDAILIRQGNVEESVARILNYSEGGFAAWVPSENTVNEGIRLKIMNPHGDSQTVSGRILWQEPAKEGGYRVGCRFTEAKSFEKLLTCVPVPLYQRIAIEDKVKWYVIAAALLALLLPPAALLLFQSDETPAVAKTHQQPIRTQQSTKSNGSLQLFPEDQFSTTGQSPTLLSANNKTSDLNTSKLDLNVEKVLPNDDTESVEEPFVASTNDFSEPELTSLGENSESEVDSKVSPFEVVFDDEPQTEPAVENSVSPGTTNELSNTNKQSVQVSAQPAAEPMVASQTEPFFQPSEKIDVVETAETVETVDAVTKKLEELEASLEMIVKSETASTPKTKLVNRKTAVTPKPLWNPVTKPKNKHHFRRIQKSYQSSQTFAQRRPTKTHQARPVVAQPKPRSVVAQPTPANLEISETEKPASVKPRTTNAVGRFVVRHVGPWMPEELLRSEDYRQPVRTSSKNSSRRDSN